MNRSSALSQAHARPAFLSRQNRNQRKHSSRNASPHGGFERLENRWLLSSMMMSAGGAGCGCGLCQAATQSLQDANNTQDMPVVVHQVARSTAASAAMWRPLAELPAARPGQVSHLPLNAYAPFTIDFTQLKGALGTAPMEFTAAARTNPLVLSLPNPDGVMEKFKVVETQILAPELAARFPDIKTYMAQGIDDVTATARFDINPFTGFHAMIRSETGTWAIDNYFHNDNTAFVSYRKEDINRVNDFVCHTVSTPNDAPVFPGAGPEGGPENIPAGTVLRTFRLAVTTTTSYNSFHGNTISSVLSAVTTAVNRITGIYETEIATRLQLVANTTLLFSGLDGNPTLSGGTNVSTLANNNQSFTDSRIGFSNYDVGHVFSSGSNNGVSAGGIGIVGTSAKARACSQTSPPSGDLFSVDYTSHEIGHQFNGRHNFSNCSGPGDSGAIANEPGSGATIMGYAGLCGSNNLQANSHAMFNHINYNQMYPYVINSIPGVGTTTPTGNNSPTVSAGSSYTIPTNTPYELRAVGSDPDGDPLVYSWEGRDTGGSFPVNNTNNTSGPIIRTWLPTSDPIRTVPRLQSLVNNTTVTGEVLSNVGRNMFFRVVARDNRPAGTGINFADMTVTTFNTGAAFMVTSPNTTGITWHAGTEQTVSWNVAGTTASPINTSNVNIRLSLDGGFTYPIMLAENTPNDGSEMITVPNNLTTQARIRVEAANNIYFDISNFNLTIAVAPATPQQPVLSPSTDSGVSNSDRITNFDNSTPAKALEFTIGGTIAGATVTIYSDGVAIGSAVATGTSTTVLTNGSTTLANGMRQITARQTPVGQPESPPSLSLPVTIDTIAPVLLPSNPAFNYATAPHSLAYAFSEDLGPTIQTSNFSVQRLPGTNVTISSTYNSGTSTATLQFSSEPGGILADGHYQATLTAPGVTDIAGNPLASGNQFAFLFMLGDVNNDSVVNLADFNILAANFGQSPRNYTQGDLNYDGVVNLADFNILASRFGQALGPASVAGRPGSTMPPIDSKADGGSIFGGSSITDDELGGLLA